MVIPREQTILEIEDRIRRTRNELAVLEWTRWMLLAEAVSELKKMQPSILTTQAKRPRIIRDTSH